MKPGEEAVADDVIDETVDDAFNDEELVDGIEAALDDQTGQLDDDDDENAEVPGLTADDVLDDADAPAEKPAGEAGVDRGDGRDAKGQFATKVEQDAADKATADAKAAGKSPADQQAAATKAASDAKAATKPADDAAAAAPKWEPFQVKADRAFHPIEGAQVARQGGHVFISLPEKEFNGFQQKIARGITLDRQVRDIQQKARELEFERTAPKPRSDAEVEAALLIETLGPRIEEILEPHELENLKLRVKIAQSDEKSTFAKAEQERRSAATSGEDWTRTQIEAITDEAFTLVEQHPELKGMTQEQIETAIRELALPVRDKIVFKEGTESFVNNEYLFKLLKREFLSSGRPSTPAPAGTTETPTPKPTTDATRFNKGQDTAAAPRSTSLKDRRAPSTPAPRRPNRETVPSAQQRSVHQTAEDDWNALKRKELSSDSFED